MKKASIWYALFMLGILSTLYGYSQQVCNPKDLKKTLQNQQAIYGGFITIPAPQVIENLAAPNKLDFVWIDAEHTPMSLADVQTLVITAESRLISAIVRIPKNGIENIKPYIGTGATGIVVPNIKTARDAKIAVDSVKYPPEGKRHVGPERANDYLGHVDQTLEQANQKNLVILMIETQEAVENINAIAGIPGIDVLHIGPYDLSLSMGVSRNSKALQSAIAKVEQAAQRNHIALGSYAENLNQANQLRKRGYLFFTIPGDMQILQSGVKKFYDE